MEKENKKSLSCRITHHSSSRYSPYGRMRDIVVGYFNAPLYPGLRISGMTNGAGGFTLIVLLVVVLIIGILAAVAVPQYQKAVEKSRAAQGLAVLRAVYEAQKVYHMANGSYATTLDELSVDIPWTRNTYWSTSATDRRSNDDWALELYRSSDEVRAVTLGRLRGKYAGGAFGFVLDDPRKIWPTDQFLCIERKANGVIFEGNAGDYCTRLFKATLRDDANAMRIYTMP